MTLYGTPRADKIYAELETGVYALAGNDRVEGDADGESVYGGLGDDLILGGAIKTKSGLGTATKPYAILSFKTPTGDDRLQGDEGRDTICGGDGKDNIIGNDGDDGGIVKYFGKYYRAGLYGGTGDDFISGGAGKDSLYGGDDKDFLNGGTDKDRVYGGDGDDTVFNDGGNDYISGGAGLDTLWGGFDADSIHGGTGADDIHGQGGNDKLYGDNGADKLYGNDGSNLLVGGSGKDLMVAGTGANKFYYTAISHGGDTIQGFDNNDVLQFKGAAFAVPDKGALLEKYFFSRPGNTTNTAHDKDDRFIYRSGDDTLWFDRDGTVSKYKPELVAHLNDVGLVAGDIFIL